MRKAFLYYLAFLNCLSCKPQPASTLAARASPDAPLPGREELLQRFREERRLLIVYSEGLEAAAQQVKQSLRRAECSILPESDARREQLQASAVLLLGSNWANPPVQEAVSQLPFNLENGELRFSGRRFADPGTVLSISFYPNPLAPGRPLGIITAARTEAITDLLRQRGEDGHSPFSWAAMGYEVYEDGRRLLMGQFDEKSWQPDTGAAFDFTTSRDTIVQGRHFRFTLHQIQPSTGVVQSLMEDCEANAARVLAFCGGQAPGQPIPCHLYNSIEEKGLRLNDTRPAQADFSRGAAHLVANAAFPGQYAGAGNALLLRRLLGKPKTEALEQGLTLYFTTNWQKKGYDYWAARLHQSGNMAPLAEILDNDQLARESPLVAGCLTASFVGFLVGHWGRETFLERYANWQPTPEEIRRLEAAWRLRLQTPPQPQPPPPPLPYLKGFNFAHEGYAIYNGYGSGLSRQSLQQLQALGATAVAIVPYSYMRDALTPAPLPFMSRAGTETDESIIQDAFTARQLGMKTVLKPQIWLGGGSWPGDVEMQSETDWEQFFDHYYRWMRHYALLAEMNGMDMLCIGVEFAKATLRENDWRALIRRLRGLYSGPMIYSANWGKEFENLQFWDALDYIGLNCYYPLSQETAPADEELSAAFRRVLHLAGRVSRQYGKPLLFTEIGFTSTPAPWIAPHKDRDGAPFDGQAQERCYRIVLENLKGETEWCHGILWWKYPSDLSHGGEGHTGFSPNGKPAEKAVKEWFVKLP